MSSYNWDGLPSKLQGAECRLLFYKETLRCGLVIIEGSTAALCLFRGCHLPRWSHPSSYLREGIHLRVNAKKQSDRNMVPFLATSIWFEDDRPGESCLSSNFRETPQDDIHTYNNLAEDITWHLKPKDRQIIEVQANLLKGGSYGSVMSDRPVSNHRDEGARRHHPTAASAWHQASSHSSAHHGDSYNRHRQRKEPSPYWQGSARDASSWHRSGRDASPWHGSDRGAAPWRESGREASPWERSSREATPRNGGSREASPRHRSRVEANYDAYPHNRRSSLERSRDQEDPISKHRREFRDSHSSHYNHDNRGHGHSRDRDERYFTNNPHQYNDRAPRQDSRRMEDRRSQTRTHDDRDTRQHAAGINGRRQSDNDNHFGYGRHHGERDSDRQVSRSPRRAISGRRSSSQNDVSSRRRSRDSPSSGGSRPSSPRHRSRPPSPRGGSRPASPRNRSRPASPRAGSRPASPRRRSRPPSPRRQSRPSSPSRRQGASSPHEPGGHGGQSVQRGYQRGPATPREGQEEHEGGQASSPGRGLAPASGNPIANGQTKSERTGPKSPRGQPPLSANGEDEDLCEAASSPPHEQETTKQQEPVKRRRSLSGGDQAAAAKRRRCFSPPQENAGPMVIQYTPLSDHTNWKPEEYVEWNASNFQEINSGEEGHAATIQNWIDEESGLIELRGSGHVAFFTINQFWAPIRRGVWGPMKEVYSKLDIRSQFAVGSKLRTCYRRKDLGKYDYQATMIWKDGPCPIQARSESYYNDLQTIASNLRGNNNLTPGLFLGVRHGVVQEYISYETGIIRLFEHDKCVAHFSLDQVWEVEAEGGGDYLTKNDAKSLQSYLPIGQKVDVLVRVIPHQHLSSLKYQVSLVWLSSLSSQIPEKFKVLTQPRPKRVEMSKQLDLSHDRFKQASQLSLYKPYKMREPIVVPACLNLLPRDGSAVVLEPTFKSSNIGTIAVTIPDPREQNKKLKLYAMFHIEDVYDAKGQPLFQSASRKTVSDLKGLSVNLIARSIAKEDECSEIKKLVDSLSNHQQYKDSKVPFLQAVVVFLSGTGKAPLVTGSAPLPSYFRREPVSLNRNQLATAFYFNLTLRHQLDLKVYEYLEVCGGHLSNASKHFLHPRFHDQKLAQLRKQEPRLAISRLETVDQLGDVRHNFGSWNPEEVMLPAGKLPDTMTNTSATIRLIWLDRPRPKYGLVKIPLGKEYALALLTTKVVNSRRGLSHLSSLLWRNMAGLRVNARLVDSSSKIPYEVTELWLAGDRRKDWSAADTSRTDWSNVAKLLLEDKGSLNRAAGNRRKEQEAEELLKRCSDSRAASPMDEPARTQPVVSRSGALGWLTSLEGFVGKVEKVINPNYGLARCYQILPGSSDFKRFFVLFDLVDLKQTMPNECQQLKSLKDAMSAGDSVRLNAVYVEEDNSWNLNYLAMAVTHVRGEAVPPPMPENANALKGSTEVKPEKINNFKIVVSRMVKKPPPIEKAEHRPPPPPSAKPVGPPDGQGKNAFSRRQPTHDRKQRPALHSDRIRLAEQERVAERVWRAGIDRRNEVMTARPSVYAQLRPMEVNKEGTFTYDCKACGIQGMSVEDAEDHINTDSHRLAKEAQPEQPVNSRRHADRMETEEALFLNTNKCITMEERNGKNLFFCSQCDAKRMPFHIVKKHIVSQAHKSKATNNLDSPLLDLECKEMRKVGRTGITYLCNPCAFVSDSIIQMKVHLREEDHVKRTVQFCHVCKEFMRSKSALSDHRFSIAHKKRVAALEEECSKPVEKPSRKKPKAEAESKPLEPAAAAPAIEQAPVVNKDNSSCTICDFKASSKEELEHHVSSASHKRQVYLTTQVMPDGETEMTFKGERCTTIQEMIMIRKAKDIDERSQREKGIRASDELNAAREKLINNLFDGGVLSQLTEKCHVRCNTCKTILKVSEKQKQLTRQLLVHLVNDKHSNKLRVQIKAEEHSGVDRVTAEQREAEEAEAAALASAGSANPDAAEAQEAPPAPSLESSDKEILAWLKTQEDVVCAMSDRLFFCQTCKTGGKVARECLKHIVGPVHDKKMTSAREWRLYIEDMLDIYEHGDGLFKCLPCNSGGLLRRNQLEIHIASTEHNLRKIGEEKDKLIEQAVPSNLPLCELCNEYFADKIDLKVHERKTHKKELAWSCDQVANLKTLSQSRNLSARPQLTSARGRILQVLPSRGYGIVQVVRDANQYFNVLFDLPRLNMPQKRDTLADSVSPGYPVIVNAAQIEPQVPGLTENLTYYASAVTIGDEEDHEGFPVDYATLKLGGETTLEEGQRLGRAALTVQLDLCARGEPTPLFHTLANCVEAADGVVVMKNSSLILVKLVQQERAFAVQVLESVLLTQDGGECSSETFEVGNQVRVNAVLMDPSLPTQYLVTGSWTGPLARAPINPDQITLAAVDMYSSLAIAYCMDPMSFPVMEEVSAGLGFVIPHDLDELVVPSAQDGGIGFDDIAAADDDDIADHDDMAVDDNGIGDNDIVMKEPDEPVKAAPTIGLKLASFAK